VSTVHPFSSLRIQVVIATRNRSEPLRECLLSLNQQTLLPHDVVVVDSSDQPDSRSVVEALQPSARFALHYVPTNVRSAARQRNLGAAYLDSDLVFFLDDDVVLEPDFVREIVRVFENDAAGQVGGVSGTITNCVYSPLSRLNRLLFALCTGEWRDSYAGRLVGPAVNFLPEDKPDTVQEVEWLPTTGVCYRKEVFAKHGFANDFEGYSFAEDVHLSSRVAQTHKLLNTTRARLYHHDLGASTHKNWVELGESMVAHRRLIMVSVLGKRRIRDSVHLFLYEIVYGAASLLASRRPLRIVCPLLWGKLKGFWKLWTGRQTAS